MNQCRIRMGVNGWIAIPAAYRCQLGVQPGDELIVRVEEGELRLSSPKLALERARRIVGRYLKDGDDLADSLVADRRAEAAREQDRS